MRDQHSPDLARALGWAVLAGLALGIGDLWAKAELPPPWPELANASLTWALAPLVLAALLRTDPVRGAVAGVVLLVVAVEAYYVFADTFGFSYSNPWSPHARAWLVLGVVTGVISGATGGLIGSLLRLSQGQRQPKG